MMNSKIKSKVPAMKPFWIVIIFSVLLSACATKAPFQTSDQMPEAEGRVKVKKDGNKNYSIDINLIHLDKPEELRPSKDYYVVWMQTDRDGTKNLGRIVASSGLFSRKKKASFNTVTPFKPIKVFITGENDATTPFPSGEIVLTTREF